MPFGVVHDGPGNAGVWIELGGGKERQILFEAGSRPTSTPRSRSKSRMTSFFVRVGDERYEIAEAVVNGG